MASLSGFRFDITGASGTQGLLSPQSSWRAFILPRGGNASQSSTGSLITFDSEDVAARFAKDNWIQAGLSAENIRKVFAVSSNSFSIVGAAVVVAKNDRTVLISAAAVVQMDPVAVVVRDDVARCSGKAVTDLIANSGTADVDAVVVITHGCVCD